MWALTWAFVPRPGRNMQGFEPGLRRNHPSEGRRMSSGERREGRTMARKASRWLAAGLAMAILPMLVPGSSAAKPGKFTATYIATPAISASLEAIDQPYGYGGYLFSPRGKPTYIK